MDAIEFQLRLMLQELYERVEALEAKVEELQEKVENK